MKLIRVVIYYYYLFYKDILKNDPILFTWTSFSISIGFFVSFSLSIYLELEKKMELDIKLYFSILVFIASVVFYYFFIKKYLYKIIEEKPKIINNDISILITILFLIISLIPWIYGGFVIHAPAP